MSEIVRRRKKQALKKAAMMVFISCTLKVWFYQVKVMNREIPQMKLSWFTIATIKERLFFGHILNYVDFNKDKKQVWLAFVNVNFNFIGNKSEQDYLRTFLFISFKHFIFYIWTFPGELYQMNMKKVLTKI